MCIFNILFNTDYCNILVVDGGFFPSKNKQESKSFGMQKGGEQQKKKQLERVWISVWTLETH